MENGGSQPTDELFSGLSEGQGPISKSGLAKRLGVSKARVSQFVTAGMPVRPDGKVALGEALAWVEEHIDPARRKAGRPPEERHRQQARGTLREETDAERLRGLRLENDRREGALVDRTAAEATIFTRARLERDAHLSWVVRIAPLLAAELGSDQVQIFTLLDTEMRRHLKTLADMPLELLSDGRADEPLG